MKLKKILAIFLTTVTVMSMSVGNVVFAEETDLSDAEPKAEVQETEIASEPIPEMKQTQHEIQNENQEDAEENIKEDQITSEEENTYNAANFDEFEKAITTINQDNSGKESVINLAGNINY